MIALRAFIMAIVLAAASPAPAANALFADRNYADAETLDPAFEAFWNRFASAINRDARGEIADLTTFPLPFAQLCLDRKAFLHQYGALFDVLGTAVAPYRQIVESRGHPGRYYAWIVHFRDANEVLEAMYEFERTGGSYRLVRIGHLDTRCP